MRNSTFLAPALAAVVASLCLASTVPSNLTKEPAQFFPQQNSQRVKIRYGPFDVGSMDINNGMTDFQLENIQMPCKDCLITWMQAGLEYDNGTVANSDTNFWLHHTVFANQNRTSTVCPSPDNPDAFFASGNERTPMNICVNGTDQAGYYIGPTDTLGMQAELMNMCPTSQTGFVTMTYEYIPNPPPSFSRVKVLWLDIGGCNGNSDQPVKSTTQAFDYTSPAWVSTINGRITFIGAHLHDGGTYLDVQRNGTEQCDCVATYGANPAYIGGGMSMSKRAAATTTSPTMTMTMSMPVSSMSGTMSMSMPSTPTGSASPALIDNIHISNISICSNQNNAFVSPGDIWTITAHYDPTQHDLMMDTDGAAAPIMGIALVYVADLNVTTTASGSSGASTGATGTSGAWKSVALKIETVEMAICVGLGWLIMMRVFS